MYSFTSSYYTTASSTEYILYLVRPDPHSNFCIYHHSIHRRRGARHDRLNFHCLEADYGLSDNSQDIDSLATLDLVTSVLHIPSITIIPRCTYNFPNQSAKQTVLPTLSIKAKESKEKTPFPSHAMPYASSVSTASISYSTNRNHNLSL